MKRIIKNSFILIVLIFLVGCKTSRSNQEYTIKFYVDGILSETQFVHAGGDAISTLNPKKDGFTFVGWDKELVNIHSDLKVNAVFEAIVYKYNVWFYDGSLALDHQEVVKNQGAIAPHPPKREGYNFIGWDKNFDNVVADMDVYSTYSPITYTINYYEGENKLTLSPSSYTIEDVVTLVVPEKEGYIFDGWYESLDFEVRVSSYLLGTIGNKTLYAKFDEIEIEETTSYIVTFLDYDDSLIDTQTVIKGKNAKLPNAPLRSGYFFYGWDKSHINIQEDTTLKATYEAGEKSFVGKKVAIIGDDISTYLDTMVDGAPYLYPYKASGVSDVNHMWWMQLINKLGMELLINNSYSGSTVKAFKDNQMAGEKDFRIAKCQVEEELPDYIFVFMGLNDCRSNVDVHDFNNAYINMTNKLKAAYPTATIVLGTLITGPFTIGVGDVSGYNSAIRGIALVNDFGLIDFESAINANNYTGLICDGLYPNLAGMNALYDKALKDLIK